MDTELNGETTVIQEFREIIEFLKGKGYNIKDSGEEDTEHQMVTNFEKILDYNDDEGEYINFGTVKIKIVFDNNNKSGGTRKKNIKRKKTTRRNRKTKK